MSEKQRSRTDPPYGGGSCENRDACDKAICDKDRRRLLGALAAGGSLSLAGCSALVSSPVSEEPPEVYEVNYLRQGQTIDVNEGQTVLGAGEDAGMELPYDCRAGFCGVCLSRANGDASELVNMRMNDVDMLNEDAVEAGYFLPCTSNPQADFAVNTGVGTGDLMEYQEEEDDEDEDEDENDEDAPRVAHHTVTYLNEQWSIEVPEDDNLLEAGEARGLDLPYQCRVGVCGQCLAQADGDASELVEMTENDYGPLDDDAIADGYLLTCTAQPRDSMDLESNKYGDLD